jgi:hypothetical protein
VAYYGYYDFTALIQTQELLFRDPADLKRKGSAVTESSFHGTKEVIEWHKCRELESKCPRP